MRDELRFASALCSKKTKRNQFSLFVIQSVSCVVIAKAIVCQPIMDLSAFRIAGLIECSHMLAENIDLCLNAFFQSVFRCGGGLSLHRQGDSNFGKDFVSRFQKWEYSANSELCGCLIYDFFDLYRC